MMCLFWRAARAHFFARKHVFLIQEMSFDYLIAFLAQKLVKIDFDEFCSFLKNLQKFTFFQEKLNF